MIEDELEREGPGCSPLPLGPRRLHIRDPPHLDQVLRTLFLYITLVHPVLLLARHSRGIWCCGCRLRTRRWHGWRPTRVTGVTTRTRYVGLECTRGNIPVREVISALGPASAGRTRARTARIIAWGAGMAGMVGSGGDCLNWRHGLRGGFM